ncbi:hypothetical protein [Rhodoferax sp. WC2427]|uniref:hypothetical protein n=1 Tax=Rhodoferax sp. WC2427 TaxID=3234144 RepID=UPI003467E6C9
MALERPIFWLGLAGLSPQQRAALVAVLPYQPTSLPAWRVAKFSEADAWCISGGAARLHDDGTLTVPDSRSAESEMLLHLDQVDRPLAFTRPLSAPEIEPLTTFEPESERAVRMVLKKFETWLQPLRAQYFLGALLHQRLGSLPLVAYDLTHQGVLLAVVDIPKRRIDYLGDASPVQLEQAVWEVRGPSAEPLPSRFQKVGLREVMWQFAQHSAADLLPAVFKTEALRRLRQPLVPEAWLKDSQRTVLRALEIGPCSLEHLLQSGLNPEQLGRDLVSLYFDGALSTVSGEVNWLSSANQRPSVFDPSSLTEATASARLAAGSRYSAPFAGGDTTIPE